MKFDFKINKYCLVGYAIASKSKPFSDWKKLEERIWKKYKEEPAYYFLNSKYINWALEKIQTEFTENNIKNVFSKHAVALEKIYQDIFKTKEFKRLYEETERHLKLVENQWQKNEKGVLKILEKVSGLPIPRHKINVYITHPKSEVAKTIDTKTIVRGREEHWKNHSTIFLCHELMHIMTWPAHFYNHFNILHAIIMLADNEIKIRLNKKGEYFKEKGVCIEDPDILPLEKKILPYWKKYLSGKSTENILELQNLLVKTFNGK